MTDEKSETVSRSRELRRTSTNVEAVLWRSVRGRRLAGMKFRRQHPIAGYYLDFFCAEAKLAIELDGGQHAQSDRLESDVAGARALEGLGIKVLRFWNSDVLQNLDGVLQRILDAAQTRV